MKIAKVAKIWYIDFLGGAYAPCIEKQGIQDIEQSLDEFADLTPLGVEGLQFVIWEDEHLRRILVLRGVTIEEITGLYPDTELLCL